MKDQGYGNAISLCSNCQKRHNFTKNVHHFSKHAKIFTLDFESLNLYKKKLEIFIKLLNQALQLKKIGRCSTIGFFSRKKMQISIGPLYSYKLCKSVEHMMDHCSTSQGVLATVSTLWEQKTLFLFLHTALQIRCYAFYALLSKALQTMLSNAQL